MRKLFVCLCALALTLTLVGAAGAAYYEDRIEYTENNGKIDKDGVFSSVKFDFNIKDDGFKPGQEQVVEAKVVLQFNNGSSKEFTLTGIIAGETITETTHIKYGEYEIDIEALITLNKDGTLTVVLTNTGENEIHLKYGELQATATPEPTTMLLFGSGLLTLGAWSRRKRKRDPSA